jgi:hypothetical protein
MDSEISGLADKHAFLKLGNNVARFSFLYSNMPIIAADFVPRSIEDDELSFDPKTLTPRQQTVSPPEVRAAKSTSRTRIEAPVEDLERETESDASVPVLPPAASFTKPASPVVSSGAL